jgi:hypothetical protein
MLRAIPVVLVVVGSVAFAQPRAPAAKVPTRPVPCAKDDVTLHSSGLDPVVCWDKGCMKLDMANTDASWIVKPAPTKRWLGNVAEIKDDKVCVGAKCQQLGKKLVAAIADHKKNLDANAQPDLSATTDLKALVIGSTVWNVKADREIKLTPPPIYKRGGDKPGIPGIDVAGDLLVVQWTDCAGPCTKFAIVDSNGINKGPTGDGGGDVFQLDAKRFAVVSEYSTVAIFDFAGKPRGIVSMSGEPDFSSALRMDDDTIVVMHGQADGKLVVKISAPDDKQIPARISETQFLPKCYP